jgi:small GTP-binding protein
MTFTSLLKKQHKRIWDEEQSLLQRMLEMLKDWEQEGIDLYHLRDALHQLHELFLLVVVGEFNSGKSALINAMLGAPYLKEGVTPTTDRVYVLRYGEQGPPIYIQENVHAMQFPVEMLRQVHIVDTPGTNAVLRHHETIVREFVPRSDMVIFVTSADRPFTESERAFLESIRQWGKKVAVVINKIDILDSPEAAQEVEAFVLDQARRLLNFEPEIFPLSARDGLRAATSSSDRSQTDVEAFRAFQTYLESTLTQEGVIRLKLLNPLGIALKVARDYSDLARSRLKVLTEDTQTLSVVERQIELYQTDTEAEFGRHTARIENDLLQMSLRGEAFLDDRMRLLKVADMLRNQRMRAAFEAEVVSDTPERVETHVQEVIDWLVERELALWRQTAEKLGHRSETEALHDAARQASGGFTYNRRQLLDSIGAKAETVIRGYDRQVEAQRLTETLKESVAMVGLVEVSAIGLGLVLKAILTTAAADATGILAAGVLGVLGLAIIPFRRGVAKREFRRKMEELRSNLSKTLQESFIRELQRSVDRLREALAPYRRFVAGEEERMQSMLSFLEEVIVQARSLQAELEDLSN